MQLSSLGEAGINWRGDGFQQGSSTLRLSKLCQALPPESAWHVPRLGITSTLCALIALRLLSALLVKD